MQRDRTRIILLALAFAIATLAFAPAPARAASVSFTLVGNAVSGWGSGVTTIADPGPTLDVAQGDTVTLRLNATDAEPHTWFIDYDGDRVADAGEPISAQFQGTTQITYTFTADRAGSFTYRCSFHPTTMTGTIVIRGADNTVLLIGGIVVVAAVVVAAAAVMMRRKAKPPAQPPAQP